MAPGGAKALMPTPEDSYVGRRLADGDTLPTTRMTVPLILHVASLISKFLVIVSFLAFGFMRFAALMLSVWFLVSIFCTVAAAADNTNRFLHSWHFVFRVPVLFLVFGVLQGAHIKHIFDVYQQRTDLEQGNHGGELLRPSRVCTLKTLDGIIEGIPFAALGMYSTFLMDSSGLSCPWFMEFKIAHTSLIRVFYYVSAWVAIATLAASIFEVDYRVSSKVRQRVDASFRHSCVFFAFRMSEVGLHVTNWTVCFVFVRPLFSAISEVAAPYLIMLPVFLMWLVYILVFAMCSNSPNSPKSPHQRQRREHVFAYCLVAGAVLVANPVRFVDAPSYATAARRVTMVLFVMRLLELAAVAALMVLSWPSPLPTSCTSSEAIGTHLWQWDRGLFVQWIAVVVVHALSTLTPSVRCSSHDMQVSEAVLEMIPDHSGEGDGMAVRSSARGLASYLLTVGTGLMSTLFKQDEQQVGDFVIERVVGRGAYGVVVLVRTRSENMGAGGEDSAASVRYAMKMQNTDARTQRTALTDVLPSRATSAHREKDIMRSLDHPFIIRLANFFEMPDREWKDESTGEVVADSRGNRRFHRAIVMEYVSGGDLESYVWKRSPPRRQRQQKPPAELEQRPDCLLSDEAIDWICCVRRFSAEMCVGVKFLHSKNVIYRDLKPQNVLLKKGCDNELHICFTDFGFSKQLDGMEMSERLNSLAGTPMYAAPEVMQIVQTRHKLEYTPSVDLYSLGRTVLVCLWRTRLHDEPSELKMPTPEQYLADPRVPQPARLFVQRLTSPVPSERGTSDSLHVARFFGELEMESYRFVAHRGDDAPSLDTCKRRIPAIDWDTIERV